MKRKTIKELNARINELEAVNARQRALLKEERISFRSSCLVLEGLVEKSHRREDALRSKLLRRARKPGEARADAKETHRVLAAERNELDIHIDKLTKTQEQLHLRQKALWNLCLVHFTPEEIERELGKGTESFPAQPAPRPQSLQIPEHLKAVVDRRNLQVPF